MFKSVLSLSRICYKSNGVFACNHRSGRAVRNKEEGVCIRHRRTRYALRKIEGKCCSVAFILDMRGCYEESIFTCGPLPQLAAQ